MTSSTLSTNISQESSVWAKLRRRSWQRLKTQRKQIITKPYIVDVTSPSFNWTAAMILQCRLYQEIAK